MSDSGLPLAPLPRSRSRLQGRAGWIRLAVRLTLEILRQRRTETSTEDRDDDIAIGRLWDLLLERLVRRIEARLPACGLKPRAVLEFCVESLNDCVDAPAPFRRRRATKRPPGTVIDYAGVERQLLRICPRPVPLLSPCPDDITPEISHAIDTLSEVTFHRSSGSPPRIERKPLK
jgi:hypothetical protein